MDNNKFVALDCGCKWKDVLVGCNFRPIVIEFALVTHSHRDHSRYVGDFVKNGIEVLSVDDVEPKKVYQKGEVKFVAFEVPHDVDCYGYLIRVDGRTIVYMTDFGYCRYTFKSWNVDTWLIASNHIENPDSDSEKYAHVVMGHSSLATVKDILAINKCDAMKNVILCHVSGDADASQMVTEIKQIVGDKVNVVVAEKKGVINL
jgi:ribonuclease BN (tRNA processing enzyme)